MTTSLPLPPSSVDTSSDIYKQIQIEPLKIYWDTQKNYFIQSLGVYLAIVIGAAPFWFSFLPGYLASSAAGGGYNPGGALALEVISATVLALALLFRIGKLNESLSGAADECSKLFKKVAEGKEIDDELRLLLGKRYSP